MVFGVANVAEVNAREGYDVGDELIVGVGRRLAASLRSGDKLVRYSGAKFALLLALTRQRPAGGRRRAHRAARQRRVLPDLRRPAAGDDPRRRRAEPAPRPHRPSVDAARRRGLGADLRIWARRWPSTPPTRRWPRAGGATPGSPTRSSPRSTTAACSSPIQPIAPTDGGPAGLRGGARAAAPGGRHDAAAPRR